MMRCRVRVPLALVLALNLMACASSQIQKARTVSVDVHAALAAVQDAEAALYTSGAIPAWTAEKHRAFNAELVVALKAGRALNEGVRYTPMAETAKADLVTVSTELGRLTDLLVGVLPP